jgi:hypothetical protein
MSDVNHFKKTKLVFVFLIAIALVSCNNAQSLEPQLQGSWDAMNTTDRMSLNFLNGNARVMLGQKKFLQGSYKLENKNLRLELYTKVNGQKLMQNPTLTTVEKLEENRLVLKWDGKLISFARNSP